jgi:hypothetical protein
MTSEFVLSVSSGKKYFDSSFGQCLDGATSTNCHIVVCAPQHEYGLLISCLHKRSGHMLGGGSIAQ